ncbi:MAG: hypothetical protein QM820_42500 [Minicystis sp.]
MTHERGTVSTTGCERFAAHLDDPRAYVMSRPRFDLEDVGRRQDTGEPVTVTARSLFLTRDVTVQVSNEPIYVPAERRFRLPDWHVDTYAGGLALPADRLAGWAGSRARVLDLASGLSLFATEAAALGFTVDCADAELGDDAHPMFAAAKRAVQRDYADQMELLRCLARHGANDRYRMERADARSPGAPRGRAARDGRCLSAGIRAALPRRRDPARDGRRRHVRRGAVRVAARPPRSGGRTAGHRERGPGDTPRRRGACPRRHGREPGGAGRTLVAGGMGEREAGGDRGGVGGGSRRVAARGSVIAPPVGCHLGALLGAESRSYSRSKEKTTSANRSASTL